MLADETVKANAEIQRAQLTVTKYSAIATTALTAMAAASVNMANQFNEGFSRVATLVPGATERIHELQDSVLELPPAVGKATQYLTDGLYEIISAFGDSAESAKILEVAAKTATTGSATTKEAISLLSAVTKGYGDTTLEAQKKVSNLAFTTLKLGQTSMPELAGSIQKATALSNELGVSQEELFAVFSSSTGVIGWAAEVATQLRAAYNELIQPGDKLAAVFNELGVQSGKELINKFGGLQGAMNAIKEKANEAGVPVNTLFGSVQAGSIVLYETGKGAEKFASDLEAMGNAAGASDAAFKETSENGVKSFGFQLQQLQLNAQKMAIKLRQELIPAVQTLLQPIMKIVGVLANASPGWMTLIGTVTKIAIALGVLTSGMVLHNKVKEKAALLQAALNKTMAANPFGQAALAITGVIIALKGLCEWLEKSKQKQKELELQNLKTAISFPKEAESVIGLSKSYIELSEKEKQTEELITLAPELAGKLSLEKESYKNNLKILKEFNREKIKEVEIDLQNAKAAHGNIARAIADNRKHLELLKETNEYKTNTSGSVGYYSNDKQIKKEEDALKDLIAQEKIYAEELAKNEQKLAQLKDSQSSLSEKLNQKPVESEPEDDTLAKKIKEQDDRLKFLDEAYKRESVIIENSNLSAAGKANSVQNTIAETASKAAESIQKYGTIATQTLNGMAGVATGIIGVKQKQNAERLAEQLSEIEREKKRNAYGS